MALAGGARIFALLDESPRSTRATSPWSTPSTKRTIPVTEANESTGMWAWKHRMEGRQATYTKLEGDIVFKDVDFGYDEENRPA